MEKDIELYEEKTKKGINLLKYFMPNYDVFKETELYNRDMPCILVDVLKEEIKDISSIVYDESLDELYVLTEDNQYKFKFEDNFMYVNDFPIEEKAIYVADTKVLSRGRYLQNK